MWTEIDQIATMTFAKEQAEKEGLAKGRAEERRRICIGLINAGVADDVIASSTGLSPEEIAALRATVS